MKALKTAVDALRAVPLRLPDESLPEYGQRLRIWGLNKSNIYKTAAAMVCALTDEAGTSGVNLLTDTDKAANGSSRASQRERMKLYMREKRARDRAVSSNVNGGNA
jgi:hypothetical protein